jgi:hypothetical protein
VCVCVCACACVCVCVCVIGGFACACGDEVVAYTLVHAGPAARAASPSLVCVYFVNLKEAPPN